MKILWVCNVPLPKLAEAAGLAAPNICGWLSGYANALEGSTDVELVVCFPILGSKTIMHGRVGSIEYYSFSQPRIWGILPAEDQLHASALMKSHLKTIIDAVNPDILHVFGTEYPHSGVAVEVFSRPKFTLVSLQGLTSFCWQYYNVGIPQNRLRRFHISGIARGNLIKQQQLMRKRGNFEIKTLSLAGHVIGRTDWDRACTEVICPNTHYHFCNESLRDCFYSDRWVFEQCELHSIFMSQAATPIKGLHLMLEAMPDILSAYPDAHLYIAGNDLTKSDTLYDRLKMSPYAHYIKSLINAYGLQKAVTFTGILSADDMKKRYLKSNVFVLPSTVENSPNSLGEAMLLGLPCVAADVGGVSTLMRHGIDGYIYQGDAPYMLAYYVKKVFGLGKDAEVIGQSAKAHAERTHDRAANIARLLEIYGEIAGNRGQND